MSRLAIFSGLVLLLTAFGSDTTAEPVAFQVDPPQTQVVVACGATGPEWDMTGYNAGSGGGFATQGEAEQAALDNLAAQVGKCGSCEGAPDCSQVNIWAGGVPVIIVPLQSGDGTWSAWASCELGVTLTIACRQCP